MWCLSLCQRFCCLHFQNSDPDLILFSPPPPDSGIIVFCLRAVQASVSVFLLSLCLPRFILSKAAEDPDDGSPFLFFRNESQWPGRCLLRGLTALTWPPLRPSCLLPCTLAFSTWQLPPGACTAPPSPGRRHPTYPHLLVFAQLSLGSEAILFKMATLRGSCYTGQCRSLDRELTSSHRYIGLRLHME